MKRWMIQKGRAKSSLHADWNEGKLLDKLNADTGNAEFTTDIARNEQMLRDIFKNCCDVVFRSIQIHDQTRVLLVFADGLIDRKTLDGNILKPWMFEGLPQGMMQLDTIGQMIDQQVVAIGNTSRVHQITDAVNGVLKGNVAILADGESSALLAEISGFETRSIEEPQAEHVVRGPREGFTESLGINLTLLRRKIRSPRLKMKKLTLGEVSQTDVVIAYIEGIAKDSVVEEVRKRVERIQIDGLIDSGYLEEFIQDQPFSPFPQVQNTERPDVVAASLLEGKVAIIMDGTPFALILPVTFWSFLQSAEDYYEHFLIMSAIRMIRYILLVSSLILPSVYVAATTFHPQLIPTLLLLSIAAAREGNPFPAVVEALLMEFMFEALREAGIRLPKAIGPTVSIVGALVIGEAAVRAGIVSAPMVIVVSITGIASFVVPRYNFGAALRLLRFPILILAGTLGFYGISLFLIALLSHLVNLRSVGVPYFSPFAPQFPKQFIKEVLIRAPHWSRYKRPKEFVDENNIRMAEGQEPSQSKGKQPS
ncbi:spore germination protein [Paenibacillus solisilvae]|uniref:Spore germination protein n=1 Tax=Paenibacillus solisilvae TaxID=2486751 RepID=A0ABW0W9V8_9BACL